MEESSGKRDGTGIGEANPNSMIDAKEGDKNNIEGMPSPDMKSSASSSTANKTTKTSTLVDPKYEEEKLRIQEEILKAKNQLAEYMQPFRIAVEEYRSVIEQDLEYLEEGEYQRQMSCIKDTLDQLSDYMEGENETEWGTQIKEFDQLFRVLFKLINMGKQLMASNPVHRNI